MKGCSTCFAICLVLVLAGCGGGSGGGSYGTGAAESTSEPTETPNPAPAAALGTDVAAMSESEPGAAVERPAVRRFGVTLTGVRAVRNSDGTPVVVTLDTVENRSLTLDLGR